MIIERANAAHTRKHKNLKGFLHLRKLLELPLLTEPFYEEDDRVFNFAISSE